MLLSEDVKNNTQIAVINDFDRLFVETGLFQFEEGSLKEHVLQINKHEPTEDFATKYLQDAYGFLKKLKAVREDKAVKAV